MTRVAKVLAFSAASSRPGLGDRSDDELVALAAAGLVEAFTELVRRWQEPVRGCCAKWCGSARADDIAQEIFHDLWRARRAYRPTGRFAAYLFTLVRNRCRNELRARKVVRSAVVPARAEAAEAAGRAAAPSDQLDQILVEERRRRVREQVAALSPKLREAVLLRFDAGLAYGEIAKIVDAPEATVRSRIFLAIAALRSALWEVDE